MKSFHRQCRLWLWLVTAVPVAAQLQITTNASLPAGMVNRTYNLTMAASGGVQPYSWSLQTGDVLPPGLSIAGNGLIGGTPTSVVGTPFNFTLRVQDSTSPTPVSATKAFSISILNELLISNASLPNGTQGVAYSASLAATGGQGSYVWNASGMPTGLSINSSTGAITGTASVPGPFTINAIVADSTSPTPFSTNKSFNITIAATTSTPTITTNSPLPAATRTIAYGVTIQATGGTTPYTWSLAPGSNPLPAVLSLNASSGQITGSPTTAGSTNFTVRVTDASAQTANKDFTITVNETPSVATASLPNGSAGTAYSATLQAAGGASPLTWSLAGGSFPAGLGMNASTGVISGSPTTIGSSTFTVRVTDANGASATRELQIVIGPALVITTASPLPNGTIGVNYNQALAASGGSATGYTWALASGSAALPAGLTLSAAGVIGGTPSTAGTSSFTAQVTDSGANTATKLLQITINASNLAVATSALPSGVLSTPYTTTLQASGGTTPYTWSLAAGSNALPSGLQLSTAGVISGTPTTTGASTITVRVADAATASATRQLTLTIVASTLSITTASPLPQALLNNIYTTNLAATGGSGSGYTWMVAAGSPPLPAGLQISATGVISGIPTIAANHTFTIQVTDTVGGTATKQFLLAVVSSLLTITTNSPLPDGTQGVAYSTTLSAAGGSGAGYLFSLTGILPPGMVLSQNGLLSGTPSLAGSYQVTIQVTDSTGGTASKPFSINVAAPTLAITTAALPIGSVSQAYTAALTAAGGTAPYTWNITIGLPPPGLSLNPSTGAISGVPTQAGSFNFVVQVRDGSLLTATADLSIQIVTLGIATTALPRATVGVAYSTTLAPIGGTQPHTWSLAPGSGPLPQGITLTAGGLLSGTPAQSGNFTFVIQVRDNAGLTFAREFVLNISANINITNQPLAGGNTGVPYNVTLNASGGAPPYSWRVISGAIPTGLTLVSGTGILSGVPDRAGTFDFVIQVTDNAGQIAERPFSIVIQSGSGGGLSITTPSLPNATVNIAYSQTLAATGGTAPYTWSLVAGSNPPPPGLSLTTAGLISGTPTSANTYTFSIRVADAASQSATRSFTLTVNSVSTTLAIQTPSLPAAQAGTQYAQALTATGGSGTGYTWMLISGQLPAGLALNTLTGVISGVPTAGVNATFTVQVADSVGATASRQFLIAFGGSLTITTPSPLPNGTTNAAYTATTIQAAGGSGTGYAWITSGGQLPAGMSLTAAGVLTGVPTAAGSFTFTVRVTDSLGATATKEFTLAILAPGSLAVTTASLANAIVSVPYTATLTASGGAQPYTWTVSAGSLPAGFSLSAAGVITGASATPGSFTFTIRAQDTTGASATRQFTIFVASAGVSISTASVPPATAGSNYSFTLTAGGGTPPYSWTISGGQMPPGLGLITASGQLTGVPIIPGTYNFTVQLTDSSGAVSTRALSIVVNPSLNITTTSLPGGSPGVVYNQTLQATGGAGPPFSWTVTLGSLPPGLTLNLVTGAISGTPSASGSFAFSVQVADAAASTATAQLSIAVGSTLSITTATLPNAATGIAYNQTLSATGGAPPLQWTVSGGALPAGLSLTVATGVISGTPTVAGSFNFTVRVQDATGGTATRALSLVAAEGLSIKTPTALPAATEGASYSQTLLAAGGTAPYTWSVSVGAPPPGLSLNASSGLISGTPSAAGSYSFIVQVQDAQQQTATKAFTVAVGARITILTPSTLPSATARVLFSETLAASGGTPPYAWALAPGGTLPIGITIDRNGAITGTPANAGVFIFSVQVTDSQNATASKSFTLSVGAGLSITSSTSLPAAVAGTPYSQSLAATGGQSPYSWSMTSGSLPSGLSLNAGGVISGAALATGTFSFTVQVADGVRASATASFTLLVRLPPTPAVSFTGLTETVQPAQQPRLNVGIATSYPVPITGTLTLTFSSDAAVPADDPAVVFTNGRRTIDFTIPANSTQAQLPEGFAMQTGTVAGTVTLSTVLRAQGQEITPSPVPSQVSRVSRSAPVIRSVRARRVAGGLEIEITGFATSREITSALFRFAGTAGSAFQTAEITVPLTDGAQRWYQSEPSRPFGSQFTLTQQFSVQGDTGAIGSVTVTMTNAQGTSQAASGNF